MHVKHFHLLLYFCTRKFTVVEKPFSGNLFFNSIQYKSLDSFQSKFASRGSGFPWYLIPVWQTHLVFLHSCGMAAMDFCSAFLLLVQLLHVWPSDIFYCWKLSAEMPHEKKRKQQTNPLRFHEGILLDLGVG